jgi:hypothetical protein
MEYMANLTSHPYRRTFHMIKETTWHMEPELEQATEMDDPLKQ